MASKFDKTMKLNAPKLKKQPLRKQPLKKVEPKYFSKSITKYGNKLI